VKTKRAVFSSLSVEWPTPQKLFDELHEEFGFTLDVCATRKNAKCAQFFTIADDGLSLPWAGRVWCNPPYGKTLKLWMKQAWEESKLNAPVVACLVPARTDTFWFRDYALQADEIRFIRGRLRFGDGKGRATFPSMVVVFRRKRLEMISGRR